MVTFHLPELAVVIFSEWRVIVRWWYLCLWSWLRIIKTWKLQWLVGCCFAFLSVVHYLVQCNGSREWKKIVHSVVYVFKLIWLPSVELANIRVNNGAPKIGSHWQFQTFNSWTTCIQVLLQHVVYMTTCSVHEALPPVPNETAHTLTCMRAPSHLRTSCQICWLHITCPSCLLQWQSSLKDNGSFPLQIFVRYIKLVSYTI